MPHVSKIIDIKEINDESVAYLVRCCDDPMSDSWLTVTLTLSDIEIEQTVADHHVRVQAKHDKKLKWRDARNAAAAEGSK